MNGDTHTHTHMHGALSAIKRNKILPFAATWMDLEGIMPSNMSDKDKYCMISLTCEIQHIQQTSEYNKEADSEIQRSS